jgi:hypothetical protein
MGLNSQLHAPADFPSEETPSIPKYPLGRRINGSYSRSGLDDEDKNLYSLLSPTASHTFVRGGAPINPLILPFNLSAAIRLDKLGSYAHL